MTIAERIYEKLRTARPEIAQEVLDFLELIEKRQVGNAPAAPRATWDASFGALKDSALFEGEPVEIQRKLRDEWC